MADRGPKVEFMGKVSSVPPGSSIGFALLNDPAKGRFVTLVLKPPMKTIQLPAQLAREIAAKLIECADKLEAS